VAFIDISSRKKRLMTDRDAQLPTPDTLSLLLASQGITAPEAQAAVHAGLQVLQDFLHTFNARDANAWAHVLNYPHVRFAGEQVTVWDNALDYAASNDLAPLSATGWAYSRWDFIRPVQADATKVHFALQFTRYDTHHRAQQSYQALYVVTLHNGHWGVQSRSSYAGILAPGAAF
jgi:hypothetical protein